MTTDHGIDSESENDQVVHHCGGAAVEAMRRILVETARDELLDLDDALVRFAQVDKQTAELAKLRLFAGLSNDEAAAALNIPSSRQPIDRRCAAYQRGLRYWLNSRFDDGSWFVKSRTLPFQSPFDSGFPHGPDQWISAAATAWVTLAIVLAVEPNKTRLPSTLAASTPAAVSDQEGRPEASTASDAQAAETALHDIQPMN